jgi:hypothetical protein
MGRSHEKALLHPVYVILSWIVQRWCCVPSEHPSLKGVSTSEVFHMEHDENEVPVLKMLPGGTMQCNLLLYM